MRTNTQRIYELMSRGTFISVDSADPEIKHLYDDIVDNQADYETYFIELGLRLESGDGYFYFSRPDESRITIEQKLQSFAYWVDILDFLKTFDISFSSGTQFRPATIIEDVTLNVDLREKAKKLYRKQTTNQEIITKLVDDLVGMGFAELINEQDGTYKVTSAFHYAEELVNLITIYNEDETTEEQNNKTNSL